MTATELVAKQTRQLRIDAHVQADNRAKRREFDLRYGNHKRLPQDPVERVRHARPHKYARATYKPRKQPSMLAQLLVGVGAVLVAAVAVPYLLAWSS